MDRADAELLLTSEALALLESLPQYRATDNVVQAVSALRDRGVSPEMTRVVLRQRRLREQAKPKFGDFAARMFFTESGLQQATRLDVAAHHAARFRALGDITVGDLGCGIGGDALAIAGLGINVIAVDRDESTAAIATYNLAPFDNASVEQGDAESVDLARFGALWFDPARRSNDKRLSNPADWSPSLEWVFDVATRIPSGIKLSPAIAHDLLPNGVEAQWVRIPGTPSNASSGPGLWHAPTSREAPWFWEQLPPNSPRANPTRRSRSETSVRMFTTRAVPSSAPNCWGRSRASSVPTPLPRRLRICRAMRSSPPLLLKRFA
jgi:SAM-dependent methyltransferase